jgi:hypothetical protein
MGNIIIKLKNTPLPHRGVSKNGLFRAAGRGGEWFLLGFLNILDFVLPRQSFTRGEPNDHSPTGKFIKSAAQIARGKGAISINEARVYYGPRTMDGIVRIYNKPVPIKFIWP